MVRAVRVHASYEQPHSRAVAAHAEGATCRRGGSARILDASGIAEPLASAFVHRIARTVKDAAEDGEEWT